MRSLLSQSQTPTPPRRAVGFFRFGCPIGRPAELITQSKVVDEGPDSAAPSLTPRLPLRRFAALRSVVNARPVGSSGSPPPPPPRRFRREKRFLPDAVPRELALTGSSSQSLRLFRVLPSRVRPRPFEPKTPSLGLPALFATSTSSIVVTGFPQPITFRPRRFSRPRRFEPPLALWVCFTPQPRPGFALQGFTPLAQPSRLVGVPCPLVG